MVVSGYARLLEERWYPGAWGTVLMHCFCLSGAAATGVVSGKLPALLIAVVLGSRQC